MISGKTVSENFLKIQDNICLTLEALDGVAKFTTDQWQHGSGGGGRSRIIQNGAVFEKGGVNFSSVEGLLPAFMKEKVNPKTKTFFATGVSIVIHPLNPFVPIIHMNIRYFETDAGDAWFGGGIDLTPIYIQREHATYFHQTLKNTCDAFDTTYYAHFKQQADDYFFIPHRNETRGVGGIFFDYLRADAQHNWPQLLAFVLAVGNTFIPAYVPIVKQTMKQPYNEKNKKWQLLRRGRYVEFNLVYDRGTRFGLETGGRTESILMSLPADASWQYNFRPDAGSAEEETLNMLRKGVAWVSGN